MKDSKYCQWTACLWGLRHEALGLVLLILATFLTFLSQNAFGIVAMFLVGGFLCCCKHLKCCSSSCCHSNDHCHSHEEMACHGTEVSEKVANQVEKKK